jgi:hypothetical protein
MSKKPQYRVVPAPQGAGFLVMRLHAVATFIEDGLANQFARSNPDIYTVSAVDNEFYVLRDEQIALFFDEGLANEYVAMKESRHIPAGHVAPSPAPINHDAIWAEATAMVQAGK